MRPTYLLAIAVLSFAMASCQPKAHSDEAEIAEEALPATDDLISDVMTAQRQAEMNYEDVVNDLMAGNKRFVESHMLQRDHIAQLEQLSEGQHPKAVVLSCIDSRVPVEEVFSLE